MPVNVRFPSLTKHHCVFSVYPCQLAPIDPCLNLIGNYFCPASNPGKTYCNYPGEYYCAYWGCETISTAWELQKDKFLNITHGPKGCQSPKRDPFGSSGGGRKWGNCAYLDLLVKLPHDPGWFIGRTWGIRYWEPGKDGGGLFRIRKTMPPIETERIGPNTVLTGETQTKTPTINSTPKPEHRQTKKPETSLASEKPQNPAPNGMQTRQDEILGKYPLWNLMEATFQILKQAHPNLTKHCWLCYSVMPPYYEAIVVDSLPDHTTGSNPMQCNWQNNTQGISLSQVTGKGRCIGQIPQGKQHLCANETIPQKSGWLVPAKNAKWVCSKTGLTPCVSLEYLYLINEFCVQIILLPRIIYHPASYMYEIKEKETNTLLGLPLVKREPTTAFTIAALLTIGGTGAGTGIAALIKGNQDFIHLRNTIDEDLAKIEQSITLLEQSLRSLSEVVLQNRRGLDLLFLKEGGLCAALKEECCVYVDHTGVVRNTMEKLRENLEKRRKERESQHSWYENWFPSSSWLPALLSTLIGPITMIVLALTFGPCIINKLVSFAKSRLERYSYTKKLTQTFHRCRPFFPMQAGHLHWNECAFLPV
uniref:Envelope glycoprotein n=1 Tax=Amazona collaria TaxID=241587 RepID=A0A8B9IXY3_9PSIT